MLLPLPKGEGRGEGEADAGKRDPMDSTPFQDKAEGQEFCA
jgi:hypothetical protein